MLLSSEMFIFLIVLEVISLVFELVTVVLSLFVVYCAVKHKAFHIHLRLLIIVFHAVSGLVGASEFVATASAAFDIKFRETSNMLAYLDEPFYRFLMTSIITGLTMEVIILHCAITERSCASIFLVSYEKKSNLFVMFLVIMGAMLVAVYLFWQLYDMTVLPDVILSIGIVIGSIISIGFLALFVQVFRWNKRRYQASLLNRRKYTLSEKFQLSENIRMNSIIWRSIVYGGTGGFTCALQVVLCVCLKDQLPILAAMFRITCLTTMNILFIPTSANFILNVPRWKKEYRRICKLGLTVTHLWSKVDIVHETNVTTITGKRLIFQVHEEKDIYFMQLQESWGRIIQKQ
ncbi:unnamed protein product [Bursaphelenchus okinawaensis]|uniref:7TM_GPCR_Srx domain-containing protein n=1 Tax=Bursaphelenchus okinawaensis TaxID=465554 RepID=A0A811LPV6_9BILA|nr:unnamed protein product [Bursaphelenchus okinawaensis]CAG9125222.1 unnamed protein product [Bursaphelenchus okinawaensis]